MTRADREAASLLDQAKVTGPPVPIEDLAKLVGAEIVYEPLDADVSGVLYRRPDSLLIAVNQSDAKTRHRFTIAHEIGHLLLHRGRPLIVDHLVRARVSLRDTESSLATDREEIEANRFAANLLMPAKFVHVELSKRLGKGGSKPQIVVDLAKAFRVSAEAMEYRLTNLGLRATM